MESRVSFAGISSPILNYVPLIIADIQIQKEISTTQIVSASHNTFICVIDGSVEVGEERNRLNQGQIGWLNKSSEDNNSELVLTGGKSGGRFILYSAQPQHDAIVSLAHLLEINSKTFLDYIMNTAKEK